MIPRFIFNKLRDELKRPEINILLGPRQVGKTTLLRQLEEYAISRGSKTAFFDLEQPSTLAEFNLPDRRIIEKITAAGDVVFIDELHYLQNASKIFKAVFDSGAGTKIVCSGSSSLEIHKHLKESLAGRRFLWRVFPLQWGEWRAADRDFPLDTYLRYGGMPGLSHAADDSRKQRLLAELLSAYILKDVKSLVKEENIRAFNHLLYLLAEHQGSLVSAASLSGQIHLSVKAVNHYLSILEETYVNFPVYSYSRNLGNELKKSTKNYFYDLGIRNAILKDFSAPAGRPDKGLLLESYVLLKLKAHPAPNRDIKFWRTRDGAEVDFILIEDRRPIPIEVKSALTQPEIPSGLKRFLARYPDVERAYVVNPSISTTRRFQDSEIVFLTFPEFEENPPLSRL